MPNFDLFCIGDSAIDQFMQIDPKSFEVSSGKFCFTHGAKISVDKYSTSVAGNAVNVSVGASKLGLSVGIYTELGDDSNGKLVLDELGMRGIDTSSSRVNKKQNTNVHAVIVANEERTIFSYHEPRDYNLVNWPLSKWIFYSSLAKGFESFQSSLVSFIKSNDKIGLVFNPGTIQMQQGVDVLQDILNVTDVLFVNENEALKLTKAELGSFNLSDEYLLQLHKNLFQLGPKLTVMTLGHYGSSCFDGKDFYRMSAYTDDRPVVDKTGAGDAFTSGFLAGMFYQKPLRECMKWGTINSSHAIKVTGSIHGLCTKEELEKISQSVSL